MSNKVIIPWEERPAGCKDVLWRSVANPIIPRDLLPTSNSIFNLSATGLQEYSVATILTVACGCT